MIPMGSLLCPHNQAALSEIVPMSKIDTMCHCGDIEIMEFHVL